LSELIVSHVISAEDGTSSVAANLQHLSLQNDDQGVQPEENNPSVIIPNHLQVHAQECSHLSFGSFGSGMNSAFFGQFASMPINKSLEETSEVVDALSTGHSEARYAFLRSYFYILMCVFHF
jgi:hypothetical protein